MNNFDYSKMDINKKLFDVIQNALLSDTFKKVNYFSENKKIIFSYRKKEVL
tara:strand:- start:29 stop:181 length:153 start_codon:yes stop_codon:yes gene_type:complete